MWLNFLEFTLNFVSQLIKQCNGMLEAGKVFTAANRFFCMSFLCFTKCHHVICGIGIRDIELLSVLQILKASVCCQQKPVVPISCYQLISSFSCIYNAGDCSWSWSAVYYQWSLWLTHPWTDCMLQWQHHCLAMLSTCNGKWRASDRCGRLQYQVY